MGTVLPASGWLRGLRFVTLLVMLGAGAACGDESVTGPASGRVFITGRVVDYVTRDVVREATILFKGDNGPPDVAAVTDAAGEYAVEASIAGEYTVRVNSAIAGAVRAGATSRRVDLFVNGGTCISRYGTILGRRSGRPIPGATVTLVGQSVRTGADGYYQIDLGCPDLPRPGGTTVVAVTHPDYLARNQVVGRGVFGVQRLDLALDRADD